MGAACGQEIGETGETVGNNQATGFAETSVELPAGVKTFCMHKVDMNDLK